MNSMASEEKKDRHKKKPLQLRLHVLVRQQLELLVDRNASTLTEEITIAVRERLARNGLWPVQPSENGQVEQEG
jgi:hypothetical protein